MSFLERLLGYVQLTASHLGFSRKRTFLTLIGLTIGITALVSLISLGNGLQATVNRQFESLGTNKFIVAPGGSFGAGEGTALGLTDRDLDAVRNARGVKEATAVMSKAGRVDFGGGLSSYLIVGGIETTAASREIFADCHLSRRAGQAILNRRARQGNGRLGPCKRQVHFRGQEHLDGPDA